MLIVILLRDILLRLIMLNNNLLSVILLDVFLLHFILLSGILSMVTVLSAFLLSVILQEIHSAKCDSTIIFPNANLLSVILTIAILVSAILFIICSVSF
jgi:hypothetical protein